jgi:putative tryptophan/tyrosine transport system substrate-binding protein
MAIDIGRRQFISVLGGVAALASEAAMILWPTRVFAQRTTGEIPRIALLWVGEETDPELRKFVAAFEQGMRAAGWITGVNVRLDYRWVGGDPQRTTAAAAEVNGWNPTVIVAVGSPPAVAIHRVTATIPIVFAAVSDPVGQGLVSSLAHPGGNITGFSNFEPGIGGKWLELLKKIVPHTTRVAAMFNPATSPYNELFERSVKDAAPSLNVEVMQALVHDEGEIEGVFDRLAGASNSALIVPSDIFTFIRSPTIVALAAKYRVPAIYAVRRFAVDGGLVAYGVDLSDQIHSAASYVDRIIKGAKPSDLPIQQPAKYTLVINLKAAKALGLEIPPNVLALADEVIE